MLPVSQLSSGPLHRETYCLPPGLDLHLATTGSLERRREPPQCRKPMPPTQGRCWQSERSIPLTHPMTNFLRIQGLGFAGVKLSDQLCRAAMSTTRVHSEACAERPF